VECIWLPIVREKCFQCIGVFWRRPDSASARKRPTIFRRKLFVHPTHRHITQGFRCIPQLVGRVHLSRSKSMDPLTSTAASGLRSSLESLDLIANNLANVQTSGYKTDREFYDLYTASEAAEPGAYDPMQMPVHEKNWTDFSQGNLRQTANPADLAISGNGFFTVTAPSGSLYTRNGAFQISSTGSLVTSEGYPVQGSDGKPLQVNPSLAWQLTPDGDLQQGGQIIGKLQPVSFADKTGLSKQGANYFLYGGPATSITPAEGQVQQGKLEDSNVGNAESAVRLVTVTRQFEMLQKAISIGAEMNQKAITDVARSGA